MKILIVHPSLSVYGGAETVIVHLASHLNSKGIKTGIVTADVTDEIKAKLKDTEIYLPKKKIKQKGKSYGLLNAAGILFDVYTWGRMVSEIGKDYDCVNAHNVPCHWTSIFTQKPFVWMCNEPPDLWNNPNPSFVLKILTKAGFLTDKMIVRKNIDTICVADEFNRARIKTKYGMDSKIINYGIEHDIFSARNKLEEQALKNRLGIGSNFTVLQVGMISPPKNQLESVNAVSSLVNKIPNIKLILAGMTYSEPYERMLKAHIKAEGLEDRVLMTGHVNKNEVRNLYNIADVVVQPVKFQGGWLAPFEAMCAGKPVIISEFVSSSDIIKKNDLGIVTGDFKEAVFQVYSNMDKYAKKAKRSSDWVKNNLRWQDYSEKMLEVCKELVR